MTTNRFGIFWSWTPRVETPEQIYDRMTRSVQALGAINSEFGSWKVMDFADGLQSFFGGKPGRPSHIPPPKNTAMGEPTAPKGFMVLAARDFTSWPSGMGMLCAGAGRMTLPGMVGTTFQTASTDALDPSIRSASAAAIEAGVSVAVGA